MRRPTLTLTPVGVVAAPLLVGTAAIHAAVIGPHLDESTSHGVAFAAMTVLALVAAVAVLVRPRRGVLVATIVGNVAIVGVWVLSRTIGLPGTGTEEVGLADALATTLETMTIAVSALALGVPALRAPLEDGLRPALRVWALGSAAVLAVLALTGPALATSGAHTHAHEHTTVVAPAAGATASISAVWADSAGSVHDHGNVAHTNVVAGPCTPTAEQIAAADALVARTTVALARFRDVNAAVAAGYRPLGFEPNGVQHYLNSAYRADGATLDPDHPESILYGRTPTGDLYPVGAMYMMAKPGEAGPRVGGCLTNWHSHGFPFARPGELSAEMMHVWTIALPGGPFAEHVEGEYARLYLGLTPVSEDALLPAAPGTGATTTVPSSSGAPATTQRPGLAPGGGLGIESYLAGLNVHGPALCALPGVRTRLEAAMDPVVVARICDPVLNSPLPGVSAPTLAQLGAALTRAAPSR